MRKVRGLKVREIYDERLGQRALGHKTKLDVYCDWCVVGRDLIENPDIVPEDWLYWHHMSRHVGLDLS